MRRNRFLKAREGGKRKGMAWKKGDLLSIVGRWANRNKNRRRPVNTVRIKMAAIKLLILR